MSRQTERAAGRLAAKVRKAEQRVDERAERRKAKGLTPMSEDQAKGYPQSRPAEFTPRGKTYLRSSKRQHERYARQQVAA